MWIIFIFTAGKAKGKRKHKKTSKKEKVVTDSVTVTWKWNTNIGAEIQTEARKEQIIRPASPVKLMQGKKQTYLNYFKNHVDGWMYKYLLKHKKLGLVLLFPFSELGTPKN